MNPDKMNNQNYEPKKNTFLHVDGPGLEKMEEGVAGQKPSTAESVWKSFKTKELVKPFFEKEGTTQENIYNSFKGRPANNIIGASINKKPDVDFGSIIEKQIESIQKTETKPAEEEKLEEILG